MTDQRGITSFETALVPIVIRLLKQNLLSRFSIASLVIIVTVACLIGVLLASALETNIDHLTLGVGFSVLYLGLVGIVWIGWRTITQQRSEFETVVSGLETRVVERLVELRETNLRLESEVEERRAADIAFGQTNLQLQETLEELSKAQRQLVQEERMRAMSQMASGVAQVFNNSLAPILYYADMLLEIPGVLENKEDLTNYLETIRTSALDATNMVKRLREFYQGSKSGDDA